VIFSEDKAADVIKICGAEKNNSVEETIMRTILIIFALVFSSTVAAFPSQSSNCSNCHQTSNPGGTISPETQSIDLGIGETGLVTFTIAGVPEDARIALFDMDTAGATVGSPDTWTFVDSGDMPYVSDIFELPGTDPFDYGLTLTGDILGTYDIEVLLAGGTPGANAAWLDVASLTVNVVPSEIPIPAAAWLFGSGLIGLVGVARRRRK
jgi:hypothetical protein